MESITSLTALVAITFTSLASAHFNLNYPIARGFDEDTLDNFPCGGQDTISSNRTLWPITGGDIALTMGHIDASVEVLIAFGNTPGSALNTVLKKTFSETGLGALCMTVEGLDASTFTAMGAADGMNATLQVVTNGDPSGGLYNCADITFSSTASAPSTSICSNQTGVSVSAATVTGNPNGTGSAGASTSTSKSGAAGVGMGNMGIFVAFGMIVMGTVL